MARTGRNQPLPGDADRPPSDESAKPDYIIHQPNTFPASGKNVAFRLGEGDQVAGRFRAELSWDTQASPEDIVVHLSAFMVDDKGQVPGSNPYFCVNHDNDRSKDGSVTRRGRRRHGYVLHEERIDVVIDLIDELVNKIVLVAYIQDANPLSHRFGSLVGGQVALRQLPAEDDPLEEELEIDTHLLDDDYREDTAVLVGELFRRAEDVWIYRDLGLGRGGLKEVGEEYGVVFI